MCLAFDQNGLEFVLTVGRKVRAFGRTPAQKPADVFTGAASPRTVGFAEVRLHAA